MTNDNDIRQGIHCIFLMHAHLVFVTKYRREMLTKAIPDDLRSIFTSVCADFEVVLMEFDGEDDPVYLLANYPPKVSVPNLVNSLKGVFSWMTHKKIYPNIQKKLCGGALWSPRCFPVAAAVPLSKLSANALNNSRRRIKIKGKGGWPSALSFSDLAGTYTKDKTRPGNGLVQEGSGGNAARP